MRVLTWNALLLGTVLGAAVGIGCAPTTAFLCTIESDCERGGTQGRCEPNRWCSFPDEACASGYRYSDESGDGLAGDCVPLDQSTTSDTDPGTSSEASATTDSPGSTGSSATTQVPSTSDSSDASDSTSTGDPPGPTVTLTIGFPQGGAGTVLVEPLGESCSAICNIEVPLDSEISLVAVAEVGSAFAGWETLVSCPTLEPCSFAIDADRTVAANFEVGVSNVIFATSELQLGYALLSVENADALCASAASTAGRAGNFIAMLSSRDSDVRDRLYGARGWVRIDDGAPVFDNFEQLASGTSYFPPNLDENGDVVANGFAWTGTTAEGAVATEDGEALDCASWGALGLSGLGIRGAADGGGNYLVHTEDSQCLTPGRLLCLQTDYASTLAAPPAVPDPRRVFVSRASFDPSSGMAAADAICASEAEAEFGAGTNPFLALLASSAGSPVLRFTAFGGTLTRPDGLGLGTFGDIFSSGRPETPILFHADGTSVDGSATVWTGSLDLAEAGDTCANWSGSGPAPQQANVGHIGLVNTWLDHDNFDCVSPTPLAPGVYCVEDTP